MWSHNYESIIGSKYASGCKFLKRNLCVGKEQYDRLRDHKVFEKSAYIYNCLDFSPYKSRDIKKKNIVTFIGGLRVTKGFHILAKVWKEVVKEVPDAELHVMGGLNYMMKMHLQEVLELQMKNLKKDLCHIF